MEMEMHLHTQREHTYTDWTHADYKQKSLKKVGHNSNTTLIQVLV